MTFSDLAKYVECRVVFVRQLRFSYWGHNLRLH